VSFAFGLAEDDGELGDFGGVGEFVTETLWDKIDVNRKVLRAQRIGDFKSESKVRFRKWQETIIDWGLGEVGEEFVFLENIEEPRKADGAADTWEKLVGKVGGESFVATAAADGADVFVVAEEGLKNGAGIVV